MPGSSRFSKTLQATLRLSAPPDRVFPLLCPVREGEWLPGWKAEILHSRSGFAELGCLFRTRDEDGRERLWTISRYEPEAGIIQFVQFVVDRCVIRLDIALSAESPGTRALWSYAVQGIEPGFEGFFAFYSEEAFQERMARLESLLAAHLG